jgi:hypothetical protein
MKTETVITAALIALVVSVSQGCSFGQRGRTQAAPASATLPHTLTVTPEIKKAFHRGDEIKIRSITGTAPTFQSKRHPVRMG